MNMRSGYHTVGPATFDMSGRMPFPVAPQSPVYGPVGQVERRTLSSRMKATVVAAAVVVGLAGGALCAGLEPTRDAAASDVQLEAISSAGADPFMTPEGQDRPGVVAAAGTGGEFTGDTAGLFGTDSDKPSCDAQSLVSNLAAAPAKATAWAAAVGIGVDQIPGYIATLNPVVLRADTAVTDYGYQDSAFDAYPAVLQAGTAVFVNSHGEPRVKCYSGNPLSRPGSAQPTRYVGPSWQGFAPGSVTRVKPAASVIHEYTVVEVRSGTPSRRAGNRAWVSERGGYCDTHRCGGGNAQAGGFRLVNVKREDKADDPQPAIPATGDAAAHHVKTRDLEGAPAADTPKPEADPRKVEDARKAEDADLVADAGRAWKAGKAGRTGKAERDQSKAGDKDVPPAENAPEAEAEAGAVAPEAVDGEAADRP